MNRHITAYFREQRLRKGLSLHALALTVAPDNVRKTAGRIGRFEGEGVINEDLFVAVAEALGIDLPVVEELMERDRQERLVRADPVHPAEIWTTGPSWTPELANPSSPRTKTPA